MSLAGIDARFDRNQLPFWRRTIINIRWEAQGWPVRRIANAEPGHCRGLDDVDESLTDRFSRFIGYYWRCAGHYAPDRADQDVAPRLRYDRCQPVRTFRHWSVSG